MIVCHTNYFSFLRKLKKRFRILVKNQQLYIFCNLRNAIEYGIAANAISHLVRTADCKVLTVTFIARHVFDYNDTYAQILNYCLFFFNNSMRFEEFWNIVSWLTMSNKKQQYVKAKNQAKEHNGFDEFKSKRQDTDAETQILINGILHLIEDFKQTCLENMDNSNKMHEKYTLKMIDDNEQQEDMETFHFTNDELQDDESQFEEIEFDVDRIRIFDVSEML